MEGAAVKGISKILRKGLKKKPKVKSKPIPRYRTDPKTGERFLNRRATVSGVKGITKKKTPIRDAALGLGAMGAAGFGAYAATKEVNELRKKLKEATDKIRAKDKKKKEKRKDNQRQK